MTEWEEELFEEDAEAFDNSDRPDPERKQIEFEERVDQQIRMLLSRRSTAKVRRDAAYWLGESGDPRAITALVQVYRKEKDQGVRQAAAYALGMFRAMEESLAAGGEEEERLYDLLEQVVLEDRMGRRVPVSMSLLRRVMAGLAVSFVVLLALGLLLPSGDGGDAAGDPASLGLPTVAPQATALAAVPTPLPPSPARLLAMLQDHYSTLDADTRTLQAQFNQITSPRGDQDCSVTLSDVEPFTVPAEVDIEPYPALVQAVEDLNEVLAQLEEPRQVFLESCAQQVPIPPEQALTLGDTVIAAQSLLADVAGTFQEAREQIPPDEELEALPTVAVPTALPTLTPTLDRDMVTMHRLGLELILEDMNAFRGKNSLLIQYWQDVRETGYTASCLDTPPSIPDPYELPPGDAAVAPPELLAAVENVNLGLELSRRSWQALEQACRTNRLMEVVSTQLITAQTARGAFDDAEAELAELQARLR